MLYFIIAIPFLFLIGVIYNSVKEQKVLESRTLPKLLKERKEQALHEVDMKEVSAKAQESNEVLHARNLAYAKHKLETLNAQCEQDDCSAANYFARKHAQMEIANEQKKQAHEIEQEREQEQVKELGQDK